MHFLGFAKISNLAGGFEIPRSWSTMIPACQIFWYGAHLCSATISFCQRFLCGDNSVRRPLCFVIFLFAAHFHLAGINVMLRIRGRDCACGTRNAIAKCNVGIVMTQYSEQPPAGNWGGVLVPRCLVPRPLPPTPPTCPGSTPWPQQIPTLPHPRRASHPQPLLTLRSFGPSVAARFFPPPPPARQSARSCFQRGKK